MRFRDHLKHWIPGIDFFVRKKTRRRRVAELRRAIFLGRYRPDPRSIVDGLEKKHVFDDIKVDLPTD